MTNITNIHSGAVSPQALAASIDDKYGVKSITVAFLQDHGIEQIDLTIKGLEKREGENRDTHQVEPYEVLTFEGTSAILSLTTVRYNNLYQLFGPAKKGKWIGQRVTVYIDWSVSFKGNQGGVRIRAAGGGNVMPPHPPVPPEQGPNAPLDQRPAAEAPKTPMTKELNDEIPF